MSSALSAPLAASAMAFLMSSLLTAGVLNYARRVRLIDQPGYRRSRHADASWRRIGVCRGAVVFHRLGGDSGQPMARLAVGFGRGRVDRIYRRPPSLDGALAAARTSAGSRLDLGLLGSPWFSFGCVVVTVVWIVAMTNAWNFMDGINGIASVNAIVAFLTYASVGWTEGRTMCRAFP